MTDNGTGDQTITIASAMANTTYAHVGMAGGSSTNLATIQQQQGTFSSSHNHCSKIRNSLCKMVVSMIGTL